MFLAAALDEYPVETRADLQRFYGIDIGRLGNGVSAFHAAACLSCIGCCAGSALLARMEAEESRDEGRINTKSMSVEEYEAWRKMKWGEVEEWQMQERAT